MPLCLLYFVGCDNNNSLHQKYIDQGEEIYIGGFESVGAQSGYNKVKFEWISSTDPRIARTVFTWAQGDSSFYVSVDKSKLGELQSTIRDFKEGVYSFEIINLDKYGNRSLSQAKSVEVYGQSYKESLRNTNVLSIDVSEDDAQLTITFADREATVQYTTVSYLRSTSPNPVPDPIRVENNEPKTIISDIQIRAGDSISVVTTYLPADGFEFVDAIPKKYAVK
jgi:hypothetical protein